MIHLGGGLDDGGGAAAVGALCGRDAVGVRLPGLAAVGGGAGHRAEIDVAGGAQVVHAVVAAFGVGAAVDFIEKEIEDLHQDFVGVGVVVAVLGCLVPKHQTGLLAAFEVGVQGCEQLVHG